MLLCRGLLGSRLHHRSGAVSWSRTQQAQVLLLRCTAGASPGSSSPTQQAPPLNYSIERAGLSELQLQQLRTYLDYMLEINQSMNLTAVRDPVEAWERHIVDSLALLPIMDQHLSVSLQQKKPLYSEAQQDARTKAKRQQKGKGARGKVQEQVAADSQTETGGSASGDDGDASMGPSSSASSSSSSQEQSLRLIDVGTGAGLPGMVFAVARPHWKVTLLDSLRKRCDFLKQAAERAGISNVDVVWSRAEEAGQNAALREGYDVAVARAVAETRVLAELCLPFVRVGGLWIAAKGPDPQAEVDAARPAIEALGGKLLAVEMVESFSAGGQRTAVVASKLVKTPAKYPRKPGTPNNQPL